MGKICYNLSEMHVSVAKFPCQLGGAQPIERVKLYVKEVRSMTIGERLYNLRKERNISQEELANKLGCELYMYEQLGHALYEEAKDFNRRVYDFLRKES